MNDNERWVSCAECEYSRACAACREAQKAGIDIAEEGCYY